MKISILSTDPMHPVVAKLEDWQRAMAKEGHGVSLHFDKDELAGGDILFLVSCSQLIGDAERNKFAAVLVLHASDLPRGRGWSPHIWSILHGENRIALCVLEAAHPVDSGPIWLKTEFVLQGHELLPEINDKLFAAELALMTEVVRKYGSLTPIPQRGAHSAPLPRRTPEDSRLDADKTIAAQFDLLRVVDNDRYPAFFDYRGRRYLLKIEKADES